MRKFYKRLFLALLGSGLSSGTALAITDISSGYQTPETLTETSDGSFLIPDVGVGEIFRLPSESAGFGAPVPFATAPAGVQLFGGIVLPASFGTAGSGQPLYAVVGTNPAGTGSGVVYTYDPSDQSQNATGTLFASTTVTSSGELSSPIAVENFGAYSGDVLITSQTGNIVALTPSGNLSIVANVPFSQPTPTTSNGRPFGIAQAPAGFGVFANDVFIDEDASGSIDTLTPDGVVEPFASISLLPGQTGLRQLSFLPAGFLAGQTSPDLLVSVSGSVHGGGTFGELLVLDSTGAIVDSLQLGSTTDAFDPRGTALSDSGNLLVADVSDPIDFATPADFVPGRINNNNVPEPASVALVAASGVMCIRRRRR